MTVLQKAVFAAVGICVGALAGFGGYALNARLVDHFKLQGALERQALFVNGLRASLAEGRPLVFADEPKTTCDCACHQEAPAASGGQSIAPPKEDKAPAAKPKGK